MAEKENLTEAEQKQDMRLSDERLREMAQLSLQRRAEGKPTDTWAGYWWFGVQPSEAEVAEWWSEQRDADLRAFWRKEGNDILQGALSSMVKKFKAMNWTLEGPETPDGAAEPQPGTVDWYQRVLSEAEFGQGWGALLGKMLQDYFTQDKGAFWELIGDGQADGPLVGPVKGVAHLDAAKCQLTGDPEYPVLFHNPKDRRPHKMHAGRVVHFVDMPAPEETMNDVGFCATSRVYAASDVLLKLARYKNEKLDDLPEPGLLLLNNVLPSQWEDQKADAEARRRRLGQEYWRNILTLIGLDPAKPVSAQFLSFASLPEGFDELQSTNLYANIVALAFGVDVREFWPISSGQLGSEKETLVMHQKARGKGVGEVISMLERAVNWYVLPSVITFNFDFRDDEEDAQAADIADKKAATIMRLWVPPGGQPGADPPVTRDELRQMLADNVPYFKEEFLTVDASQEGEVSDTERRKGMVYMDRKGFKQRATRTRPAGWHFDAVLDAVEDNYRRGLIRAEELADFALAELMDRREGHGA